MFGYQPSFVPAIPVELEDEINVPSAKEYFEKMRMQHELLVNELEMA